MTEQEAIEWLKAISATQSAHVCKNSLSDRKEALYMGIQAIREIQQYRAIGTVEEFAKALENTKTLSRMYEKLNDQEVAEYHVLREYEAIGTVEECREAREKQKPKIPDVWGDGYSEGEMVYDMYDCPGCGESYEIDGGKYNFCPSCGQALDWSI